MTFPGARVHFSDGLNTAEDPMTPLIRELCDFATGVVVPDNEPFFERLRQEVPLVLRRYPSGQTYNGWTVPPKWSVETADIRVAGRVVFDGTSHPLGVAAQSRSFHGELDAAELARHVVTNPSLPDAYVYHCMWQYRPWDTDWSLSVPYRDYERFGPGPFAVDLATSHLPGEMLVGVYDHKGHSEDVVVFNAHTCHPGQANDDMAGVVVLLRLFQWLRGRETHYTYRLVLGPEHLGTVFYLRDLPPHEIARMVGGVFAEMPGTDGPLKISASFLGDQAIDRVVAQAASSRAASSVRVPWRRGAGNDETVWEAPGYEVPFVEVSRSLDLLAPYREYHTSLDTPALMRETQLREFLDVLRSCVEILEGDATMHRRFDGIICLSNPQYDLYVERPDPAVVKDVSEHSEKWGYLLDCLLRYFDGRTTLLEVAKRHGLPFEEVLAYVRRFEQKGLVDLEFARATRPPAGLGRDPR